VRDELVGAVMRHSLRGGKLPIGFNAHRPATPASRTTPGRDRSVPR
jgi:hypothetical protein